MIGKGYTIHLRGESDLHCVGEAKVAADGINELGPRLPMQMMFDIPLSNISYDKASLF